MTALITQIEGVMPVFRGTDRPKRHAITSDWANRTDVRPLLVIDPSEKTLFLTCYGQGFNEEVLGRAVRGYMLKAGITHKPMGCHLIRHTCATHMLEGGADIRYIQELLGHEKLDTTAIYTQVTIEQLKAVHAKSHPAEKRANQPE